MSNKLVLTAPRGLRPAGAGLFGLGFALLITGILLHDDWKVIALGMGFMGSGSGVIVCSFVQLDHNRYEVNQYKQGPHYRLTSN